MTTALATLLLCLQPVELARYERVDLIQLHHFYDDCGEPVWDQTIYKDFNHQASHHDIFAWRIVKSAGQVPYYDHERKVWVAIWQDGDTLRHVEAQVFEVIHAQIDPELDERQYIPEEARRGLRK